MAEVRTVSYETPDGFRLVGKLTKPSAGKLRGWAIMAHGILETKDEYGGFYVDIADALSERGIGSLRFDFRGHGESSGTTMDISVVGDVIDLKATIGQLPIAEGHSLALVGTSFGAGPSIFAAGDPLSRVSCLVLIAPVLDYARTFLRPTTSWAMKSFTPAALEALKDRGFLLLEDEHKLSPRLIEEFRLLRPYEDLSRLSQPCLIIHGDRDSMVPYETSVEAAKATNHITFHPLPRADHGFTDSEDDTDTSPRSLSNRKEIVETTASFVADHVR